MTSTQKIIDLIEEIPRIMDAGRFSSEHKEWIKKVKEELIQNEGEDSDALKEFLELDYTYHPTSLYVDCSDSLLKKLDRAQFELQMDKAEKILKRTIQD